MKEVMKKVWIFRHGPKETGPKKDGIYAEVGLKPEARVLAKQAVEAHLKDANIKKVLTSPLVRAYQNGMLFSLLLEMGNYPEILKGLGGSVVEWARLLACPELKGTGYKVADFYRVDPTFVESEGKSLFNTLIGVAACLKEGEEALCVSHGGFIEQAMAVAEASKTGDFEKAILAIHDLKEGEGVIFKFDENNNFIGLEEKSLS